MDIKIEIKEEHCHSDDVVSQSEKEYFHKVVSINTNSDAVLLDNGCDVATRTEVKSETPFPEHFINEIKFETVTCSNNWEIDRKTEIEEQSLVSELGPQNEGEFLSEDPVMTDKQYYTDHEMDNKRVVKVEPCLSETETSSEFDDIKNRDFPPVKSPRLCKEAVRDTSSDKSPLALAEVSENDTSFYNGKYYFEPECQKCEVTETPAAKECFLSEQSGKYSTEGEMHISPLYLKHMSLIHKGKRTHQCKICSRSFTYLLNLKIHNLIHEGMKPQHSKLYDKRFTCLSNLKTDNLTDGSKKPHQCKSCGRKFAQLGHLKSHTLIHEGKKPFQCKMCGKSFTQQSTLKTHTLIHEGKKPHQCKICDKSFTQLSTLKTHNLIHEGKKAYQCKICGKRFFQLSSLKTHNLIHEDRKAYQCKTCYKRFTRLSHLKTHNSVHEGKKPYQCKTCDKRFTHLSSLKRHNLTHEGKKPHQCNICLKSFTQLSHLKRHNLVHEDKN